MRKKEEKLPTKREKRWVNKWLEFREDSVTISNLFALNRITFDIHQWRILFWIMGKYHMKVGDRQYTKEDMKPYYKMLEKVLFVGEGGNVRVMMPVSFLLSRSEKSGEVETSLTVAKDAIKDLSEKGIDFMNWDVAKTEFNDDEKHIIGAHIPVLAGYVFYKQRGEVYVDMEVHNVFWKAITDFSKGIRTIEISTLLKLQRQSSIKFYMWISRQSQPIVRPIRWLREMLDCEDTYPETKDFIKRQVKAAKQELDKVSPFTFEYKTLGRLVDLGRYKGDLKKLIAVQTEGRTFYYTRPVGAGNTTENLLIQPKYQEGKNVEVDSRLPQFWTDNYKFSDLSKEEKIMLNEDFFMTDKDIIKYQMLILDCKRVKNGWFNSEWRKGKKFIDWLSIVKASILLKKDRESINRIGYLKTAIENEISTFKEKNNL